MTDIYTKNKRSSIMASVKSKNTAIEKEVFSHLTKEGVRYRKHYKKLPGKPDIVIISAKKVIFVDGDFWHGWHYNKWAKKLPSELWRDKIEENIKRDKKNFRKLRNDGWRIMRIWEHQMSTKIRKQHIFIKLLKFINS